MRAAPQAAPATDNPRYFHYARVHGRTPDAQRAHDRTAWPGGCAIGFMLWMSARWGEWHNRHKLPRDFPKGPEHYADFDARLAALPAVPDACAALCCRTPVTV